MQTKDCLANLTPKISTRARYDGGEGGEICKTARALCKKVFCHRFTFLLSYHSACTTLAMLFLFILHDIYIYKGRLQRDEIQHPAFSLLARR